MTGVASTFASITAPWWALTLLACGTGSSARLSESAAAVVDSFLVAESAGDWQSTLHLMLPFDGANSFCETATDVTLVIASARVLPPTIAGDTATVLVAYRQLGVASGARFAPTLIVDTVRYHIVADSTGRASIVCDGPKPNHVAIPTFEAGWAPWLVEESAVAWHETFEQAAAAGWVAR